MGRAAVVRCLVSVRVHAGLTICLATPPSVSAVSDGTHEGPVITAGRADAPPPRPTTDACGWSISLTSTPPVARRLRCCWTVDALAHQDRSPVRRTNRFLSVVRRAWRIKPVGLNRRPPAAALWGF